MFSDTEYSDERALMIARVMQQIKDKIETTDGVSYVQQYHIHKGLKLFKEKGEAAATKEMEQLIKRNCFSPMHVKDLSELIVDEIFVPFSFAKKHSELLGFRQN